MPFERTDRTSLTDQPIIEEIRRIWERLLQQSPIDIHDDFFDLGGDSLLVAAFCTEVERRLGLKIPFPALYEAPTISAISDLIGRAEVPRFPALVPLNAGTGRPPLFVIPGGGGSVIDFAGVGPLIGNDRAVIGVQARGMDGSAPPLDRIEEMAEYSLAAIRQIAPHGPYLFAGYSMGGLVAMEMARRALKEGDRIDLLALIDTYPHSRFWPVAERLSVRTRRVLHLLGALAHALVHSPWKDVVPSIATRLGISGSERSWAESRSDWNPFDPATTPESVRHVHAAGLVALERHVPQAYSEKISFIRAARRSFYVPGDPVRQWRDLAPRLRVHTVPGNHIEILSRYAPILAACLSSLIENEHPDSPVPLERATILPAPPLPRALPPLPIGS